MTGRAEIVWGDGDARAVRLTVQEVVETADATPLRLDFRGYSPFNPA